MNKLGSTLERLLKERGITYYQVSKATGIRISTLSLYTTGPKHIKIENLIKLADYLGVSVDMLLRGRLPIEALKRDTVLDFKLKQIQAIVTSD